MRTMKWREMMTKMMKSPNKNTINIASKKRFILQLIVQQ